MLTRTNPLHGIMFTDHGVLLLGSLLLCLFLLPRIQRIKQVWQGFGNLPAYSFLVSPFYPLSRILPRIPWISDRADFSWKNPYEREALPGARLSYQAHGLYIGIFAASKADIVQLRTLFPRCVPQLLLADATAAKVRLVTK